MSNVSVDATESAHNENQPENNTRRRFLTVATSVVGGVGVVGAAVPFIASWNPSAKAKAAGADVEVDTHEDKLKDPNSEAEQQPAFAQNRFRSMKEEYLILVGICTHLGCSPQHLKDGAFEEVVEGVPDGFFCPCHGSKFDMAGRVFQNVPAPLNLVVPPYQFVDDNNIIIGSEAEAV